MTKQHLLFVAVLSLLFTTVLVAQDECPANRCPDGLPCTVTFYGGQDIDTGDVSFTQTGDLLFVQVDTRDDWRFDQLHVYVGTEPVPTNGAGNPRPGHFPYALDFDSLQTSHTLVVSLQSLGIDTAADSCAPSPLHMAVHGELINLLNDQEETGFAYGDIEFPGRRWGWSLCLGVDCQTTDPPPPPPPPADCDPFMQTQEEFDACCAVNADDIDCAGPIS